MTDGFKFILFCALGGGAVFAVLIVFVLQTGSTFGQRCTAVGHTGQAWEDCVDRLANGGSTAP